MSMCGLWIEAQGLPQPLRAGKAHKLEPRFRLDAKVTEDHYRVIHEVSSFSHHGHHVNGHPVLANDHGHLCLGRCGHQMRVRGVPRSCQGAKDGTQGHNKGAL